MTAARGGMMNPELLRLGFFVPRKAERGREE
jgi:hypothetical protein